MAELLRDVFKGLRDYFQTNLTADRVVLGFRDERSEAAPERDYPEVTVTLYDARLDNVGRYGGLFRTIAVNPDGKTAKIGRIPSPLNLYFQLDTFCEKREDDWILSREAMEVLADRYTKITTDDGRVLHLFPVSMDVLDTLTADVIWRKAYRFFVQVWLDSPAAAEDAYLVLVRRLKMEGEVWDMDLFPVDRIIPESLHYAAKLYATIGLTQEDAKWLAARCDLFITDGSGEQIVSALRSLNPGMKLFRYFGNPLVGTQKSGGFRGAVWENYIESEHPDWIWRDNQDPPQKIWKTGKKYFIAPENGYDPPKGSVQPWANYWLTKVLEAIGNLPYHGVKADLSAQSLKQFHEPERTKLPYRYDAGGDIDAADVIFVPLQEARMAALKAGLNAADLLFIPNNIGILIDHFLSNRVPNIDGFLHQWIFMTYRSGGDKYQPESTAEAMMDILDACRALGKLMIIACSPSWDLEEIRYCVHCYNLVSSHPYTFLNIDTAGGWEDLQTLFNNYSEAFETDFGQPVGERYKESGVWKRRFENAMILEINLINRTYSFGPE